MSRLAAYDEKSAEQLNSRNGYRGSVWDYVHGISTLSVDDR